MSNLSPNASDPQFVGEPSDNYNPNVLNVAHHFIASLIGTIHQKILKHQQEWKFFALLQADGLQGKLMKMQSWQAVTAVEE